MKKWVEQLDIAFLYRVIFGFSALGFIAIFFDFGYEQSENSQRYFNYIYFFVITMGGVATIIRFWQSNWRTKIKIITFDILYLAFSIYVLSKYFLIKHISELDFSAENSILVQTAVVLTFIREYSDIKINYKRTILNPAQLFILSFLVIILIGTYLLRLPGATHGGLSFMDALFTSTSAVCVTGLAVVDTGTYFTVFGQSVLMGLIQVGGLGILTFASYFSYFFKGGTSYENQLALSDLTSTGTLSEVFSSIKYIILITMGIEALSASLIYLSLDPNYFNSMGEMLFFSFFHSVSAFCNAGFSTLNSSFYQDGFRYNYPLQSIIILTFVLGGLGFPIVVNILSYFKYKISVLFKYNSNQPKHRPWVVNLNSRITLITTFSITIVATFLYYVLEFNNTLSEHYGFGKWIAALFGATTPRTAGFNNIDMSALSLPSLMMTILLMWIGASPQSTGGGIKTSTFAIAILNIMSIAKGKSKIEVYRREISEVSVRRSFAIISLSLAVIGFAITLICIFDPHISMLSIAFECFSAYGTVGLSLNLTPTLSNESKMVLIFVMFIGRISMLSLVIAIFKKVKHKNYRYPKEEITIN